MPSTTFYADDPRTEPEPTDENDRDEQLETDLYRDYLMERDA